MDPLVTSSLISGGVSILGGLFGSKKSKGRTPRENMLSNAQGAMEAQEKYGINALELLRSGAGSGGSAGDPRVGSIAAFTNGFDQIADVLSGRTAQEAAAREVQDDLNKIELDIRKAELDKLGLTAPLGKNYRTEEANEDLPLPTPIMGETGRNTVTNTADAGSGLYIDPRVMDAEVSEARYGDIVQEVTGARNVWKDNVFNARMQKLVKQHGREKADAVFNYYRDNLDKTFDQAKEAILGKPQNQTKRGSRRDRRNF